MIKLTKRKGFPQILGKISFGALWDVVFVFVRGKGESLEMLNWEAKSFTNGVF